MGALPRPCPTAHNPPGGKKETVPATLPLDRPRGVGWHPRMSLQEPWRKLGLPTPTSFLMVGFHVFPVLGFGVKVVFK